MLLGHERQLIAQYGRRMLDSGLTRGTGGNISIFSREKTLVAISPSGLDYEKTTPVDVPIVDLNGRVVDGNRKPSSELPFHLIFYVNRADIGSVVHTHSTHATVLACLGLELPAVHYLIGFAGGSVRCAPYATFGTETLARHALEWMNGRRAVLLANHGLIAGGGDIHEAFRTAESVEFCAELYCRSRALGHPLVLSDEEMSLVSEKFKTYGKQ